jgi:hypothetical protein
VTAHSTDGAQRTREVLSTPAGTQRTGRQIFDVMRLTSVGAVSVLILAALLAACTVSSSPVSSSSPADARSLTAPAAADGAPPVGGQLSLPPVAGRFSYQIGGAYTPPAGVTIVDRDRSQAPAAGSYSICYINAYQAQVAEVPWWQQHHADLLLRGASGALVIDKQWNEPLFDLSTEAKRAALVGVVGSWIDDCARRGYRAIEPDNLDSYSRSQGRLTAADALAFATLLAKRAHQDAVAIAQKNAADLGAAAHRAGFDFAIAEECQVFEECGAYTDVYAGHVIEIEYTDQPIKAFDTACQQRRGRDSIVLRDRDVTPSGQAGYVERWC